MGVRRNVQNLRLRDVSNQVVIYDFQRRAGPGNLRALERALARNFDPEGSPKTYGSGVLSFEWAGVFCRGKTYAKARIGCRSCRCCRRGSLRPRASR
jgi:hypothetical protein